MMVADHAAHRIPTARIPRIAHDYVVIGADVVHDDAAWADIARDPREGARLTIGFYLVQALSIAHAREIFAASGRIPMLVTDDLDDIAPVIGSWDDVRQFGYGPENGRFLVCESCESPEPCSCTYCGSHDLFDCWFAH